MGEKKQKKYSRCYTEIKKYIFLQRGNFKSHSKKIKDAAAKSCER